MPLGVATLVYTLLYMCLSFFAGKNYVFKLLHSSTRRSSVKVRFLVSAIGSWLINYFGIYFLSSNFVLDKGFSSVLIVPVLVIYSYFVQKFFVFV